MIDHLILKSENTPGGCNEKPSPHLTNCLHLHPAPEAWEHEGKHLINIAPQISTHFETHQNDLTHT